MTQLLEVMSHSMCILRQAASVVLRVALLFTYLSKDWQLCWFDCGRRTRPFGGRAFREQRTDIAVSPFAAPFYFPSPSRGGRYCPYV